VNVPPPPLTLRAPPVIAFGAGCAPRAIAELAPGRRRALIITSPSVRPHAERAATPLREAGVPVDTIVVRTGEPTLASAEALRQQTRSAAPDLVVAIGGGSVLDAAKIAAALHDRDEPLAHFFGSGLVPGRRTALACVPTTAGTGSEVSPNALLLDEAARAKKAIISPALVPDAAIVDPEFALDVPATVTAATGIDALAHCLEAYASLAAHPVVDLYALEGVRLIGANLARAVADGRDIVARSAVALGSLYGGLCLGPVNTNGVHALAYPLGGEFHLPHALSIALLLPHVVAFNCSALPGRHAALARALGAPASGHDADTAARLPDRLRALLAECGIPLGLSRHGIPRDALPRLADAGLQVTRLLKANPRPVSRDDARRIYEAAY
jgi:alcohol dehydrogenase class IV